MNDYMTLSARFVQKVRGYPDCPDCYFAGRMTSLHGKAAVRTVCTDGRTKSGIRWYYWCLEHAATLECASVIPARLLAQVRTEREAHDA